MAKPLAAAITYDVICAPIAADRLIMSAMANIQSGIPAKGCIRTLQIPSHMGPVMRICFSTEPMAKITADSPTIVAKPCGVGAMNMESGIIANIKAA